MLLLKSFRKLQDRSMVHIKCSHLRSLSFRERVLHPNTRIDGRLLGPCFKTGSTESLCQYPWKSRSSIGGDTYLIFGYNIPKDHIP